MKNLRIAQIIYPLMIPMQIYIGIQLKDNPVFGIVLMIILMFIYATGMEFWQRGLADTVKEVKDGKHDN